MDDRKEQGFTLIELMLALAIVGIVVALSTGFIVDLFNIVQPSAQRMNTKQIAEIRLTEISKYVRAASAIDQDDDKIILNGKTIVEHQDKTILINNSDGTLKRSFSNIKDFNIVKLDEVYEIIIEVCRDDECSKFETVSTKIVPRNTTP
jgi:prepilin-type N-terminal cleavage/methylation domain-containing protein